MKASRRRFIRIVLLGVVPLAAIAVGAEYMVSSQRFVTTENAYVKANQVQISAEIDGRVAVVAVSDNMDVAAGTLLFQIEDEPFRISLEKARAELEMVRLQIAALRAEYRQAGAELIEAEQDLAFYEREFERQQTLSRRGIASQKKRDEAARDVANAKQRISRQGENRQRILARLGGAPDMPIERHPEFREAKAKRDEAELNLRRTMVYAPAAGRVGRVTLQRGEYVRAGQPILPLVETGKAWIEANLKETQLTHVSVGQRAKVTIDAYPSRGVNARVASISPLTGAEQSILPPQNASGNWVKVVQRIPVRLEFSKRDANLDLRSGMTARVRIDTGREYSLIDMVGSAFAGRDPQK